MPPRWLSEEITFLILFSTENNFGDNQWFKYILYYGFIIHITKTWGLGIIYNRPLKNRRT